MTDPWRRLRSLVEAFAEDDETFEHLVDQATLWLSWSVLHADPTRPAFHRHNDLISQWGGPNADNVYRHARIDAGRRYRVRGQMHGCEEFVLALRAGFMHNETWGTLATVTASELGIGPGDEIDVVLGDGGVEIPDGAITASIREYYFDWTPEEPATFTIECLDPTPIDLAPVGERLDRAIDQISDSLRYWVEYMEANRANRVDNAFATTTVALPTKGLAAARYEFCFWDLQPDEALIIETDVPAARYWAAQLYMMRTFEPVDPYGAITSRNHTQTTASSDGRVRFVLAATDPGVPNWLDTTGRRTGLCTIRWFWPTDDTRPAMDVRLVTLDEIGGALPPDTSSVSADERSAELASRRAHLRWRFRT
ncbi:MAG: DUF1214 domain-containing protein [Actinomycetota bacterium]